MEPNGFSFFNAGRDGDMWFLNDSFQATGAGLHVRREF